ncbi:DUF2004 domain-containing protein [Flavobacterium sp.]|uniref:DUF2004 domain-containing protein n=1 Tax=Flavobacterium sp. TaxID=239 RepID=UPI0011F5F0B4|nr:DUF2004 domain-containing protein [Flavobacterium sp.]RZJ73019.1 MAG: DUF2004 domain-containing protein [Flavobacterium sp.]
MLFPDKYTSSYFGELDLNALESWHEAEIELHGRAVEIALTFMSEDRKTTRGALAKIDEFLDGFALKIKQIESVLAKDYRSGRTVKQYIDFLTEEIDEEEIMEVMPNYEADASIEDNIFRHIHLLSAVFYPEAGENIFAILDYSISKELTDELLVARLKTDNSLDILIES